MSKRLKQSNTHNNPDCNSKLKILLFYIVIFIFVFLIFNFAYATTNISPDNPPQYLHWAWNDNIGWIDFYITDNVNVATQELTGYASSSVGYIALNCNSTPDGPKCAAQGGYDWKVSNDGAGNLSGWGWNDAVGWVSFDSVTGGSPYTYQVTIGASSGEFSGWAWNDSVGWISFNCSTLDPELCETSNYKVKTSWVGVPLTGNLISSVYDTQVAGGIGINTIMWQGNQPAGTVVKFQIASSNSSSGPSWSYMGPDGSDNTYYLPNGPNVPIKINPAYHSNHRYFRYKVFLETNIAQTQSPRVDDVIMNWSP